jgi:predicted TPR repeat methyltransferase
MNRVALTAQDDPRLHILGMELAEAAGNPAGALASAERAVRKSPQWAPGVMNLALLHARQNRFPEALQHARQALALAPRATDLLEAAVQISLRSGNLPAQREWLTQALAQRPGHAPHQIALADAQLALGEATEALAAYDLLLAQGGELAERAAVGRAYALLGLGQREAALATWDELLARQPDNAAWTFQRALAAGEVPTAHPQSVVGDTFDGLAEIYDMHMLRGLRYRLPKDVADRLLALHPDRNFHLLDLGCGTGLLGLMLGKIGGSMIGVDASLRMIEQAERHGVYDRFHQVDLLDALRETPAELYHVITALDVFIYIGELGQAITDAHRILRAGGRLIFSCEVAPEDGPDMIVQPSNRYAHKRSTIEALCRAAGFAELGVSEVDLRLEAGQPVKGFLVEARKAG